MPRDSRSLLHRAKWQPGRPCIADLFCCQGGAGEGYWRAGFNVIGFDIEPQPRYPFEFNQSDALEVLRDLDFMRQFDAIHASPPCQAHLNLTRLNETMGREHEHVELIAETRTLLERSGLPYVIENVADARGKLRNPVRVCGTSFGLPLRRHRLFESNVDLLGTQCAHHLFTEPKYWTGWRPKGEHRLSTVVQVYGNAGGKEHWPTAMGIDWMDDKGLAEAVPPSYTEHIGAQLMRAVVRQEVAA